MKRGICDKGYCCSHGNDGGLFKKMRLDSFDVWWSWQVPVGCLLSYHLEYLSKYWAERGRDPLLPAEVHHGVTLGAGSAVTCLPSWRPITNIHRVFLRVTGGFRCFLMEWLGFFFSFLLNLVSPGHLLLEPVWFYSGRWMVQDLLVTLLFPLWKWREVYWHCSQFTGEEHQIFPVTDPPAHWYSGLEKLAGNILSTGDYWIIYWQAIGWHLSGVRPTCAWGRTSSAFCGL